MTEKAIEKKGEVYLENGRRAWLVGSVGKRFVVRPMWDGAEEWTEWEDEPPAAETEIVDRIYDTPPQEAYHEEIKALRDRIRSLRSTLDDLMKEIRDGKRERDALIEKLAQIPALRRIEEHIEGRFTHFVVAGWNGPRIMTREAALESEGAACSAASDTKLMVLLGKSNGHLEWHINQYRDGSGGWGSAVYPCRSEEDAVEKIQEILSALPERRPEKVEYGLRVEGKVRAADEYGLEIAPWTREYLREISIATAKENLAEATEAFKKAQAAMRKLED